MNEVFPKFYILKNETACEYLRRMYSAIHRTALFDFLRYNYVYIPMCA